MQLIFLGGADEVGASSTFVEVAGKRILIDAGIRISPRTNRGIQDSQLPDLHPVSEAGGPDYILVTHAHTDHTGALPLVVERYPVPVLATAPTIALVRTLQADAQRIMQSRQEQEGELPLFDEVAVNRLLDNFQVVEFGRPVRLAEGLQVTYYPAGHILGASMVALESDEGALFFTGDFSFSDQRVAVTPVPPRIQVDTLITESTYGGKLHANRVAEEKRLVRTLQEVIERGGRVLIPAFAIGRAQEVIQIILANRDLLDAPVYVDGMVRSVCNTYAAHSEYLPEATVEAADDDPLFFRQNVQAVRTSHEREEIARAADGPAIVVASSGMLTGGASVVYARHFAADERSAILLTGYQDEESPGRFLQNITRRREAGEEVTLTFDDRTVTVRCTLGTYSLSAHADEGEMVSFADALGAEDVFLVHGDPAARHSLGARLRERHKRVRTPAIGQTYALTYATRLVKAGGVSGGARTEALDPAALWEALQARAGDYFTAAELARMWWGDESRAAEVVTVLDDGIYFSPDWRRHNNFRVRTPEQVARNKRRRAIMAAHPKLVGQVIVLRDSNNRPRLGVVVDAKVDGFEAYVRNAKGRHYPADALLWPIGQYRGAPADERRLATLTWLFHSAQEYRDRLLPLAKREALVEAEMPVIPVELLPPDLPEDVDRQVALLAVVWTLAEDGATLVMSEDGTPLGVLPKRAMREGPLEMNLARETAMAIIPAEARLRKVGMEIHRRRMTLSFDFPDRATQLYTEQIAQVEDQTGWDVVVNPRVNQLALGEVVDELLPEAAWVTKGPSFYMDRRQVQIEVEGVSDVKALAKAYRDLTGFQLLVGQRSEETGTAGAQVVAKGSDTERMEINAAYDLIRGALEPFGLYKTSLKQGQIVLTFISPQVGARHQAVIEHLAEQTGYPISIHPYPNQQKIIQVVNRLARDAGWNVYKSPSLYMDRGQVGLKVGKMPDDDELAEFASQIEEETGYRLVVEV